MRRCLSAVLATLAVVLFAASGANAQPFKPQQATGVFFTVDDTHPTLPIGTTLTAPPDNGGETPVPAELHEHGDVTAQQVSVIRGNDPADESASAAQVSVASCRSLFGSKKGERVLNHYNYCQSGKCGYYWVEDKKIVGIVTYRCTTAGQGTKGSRAIRFETGFDNFKVIGKPPADPPLRVYWATNGYSGVDGSNKPCSVHGDGPQSQAEWENGKTAIFTISSAKTDGYSRDFVSRCSVGQWGAVDNTVGNNILQNGVRFDSASYLGSKGAGIFDRVKAVMHYSLSSSRHGAVAAHIHLAQTNPAATYPPLPGGGTKSIPGSPASGKPLHRLMSSWDGAATTRYNKNRAVVSNTCAALTHQPDQECDEYPFASTWEGAGKGDGNFSVQYLDKTQNGNAGTDLNNWYVADRILHNDEFYVQIDP
ncbi:NucA/NucB deoxyribonuclease domain-containing protein [Streptantibioticus ferralitis]|uniref:NucA/NucB deoxyribonuclease domain-containing protein n=1 Tax=Streptantibioticus ferralitis TaxID=236510 RepID=A0ABT5YS64_9ACTN|nr:NucA/NucB deoxyribonuclease domain-containing protein [Streptantibioticus ferralitis]MDF2254384.1 NucA/NucB deoxyribonuclease domain-containing protein [Streptantibioticus ferralitis]